MKKLSALILAILMIAALFAGCTGEPVQTSAPPSPGTASPINTNKADDKTGDDDVTGGRDVGRGLTVPLVDDSTTLTMWRPMVPNAAKRYDSMGGVLANSEKAVRTGVTVEFLHPAIGSETEGFRLLVASQDFPDMIGGMDKSTVYVGGPDKAIEDGVFIRLNEYLDEFAPNFKSYLDSDHEIYKRIVTDEGNIPYTVTIQMDLDGNVQPPWIGPMMRLDWLDDLGLGTPQTYDDWYEALKLFRDEKGADMPLTLSTTGFESTGHSYHAGFGVSNDFYNENGVIKYGFLEPGMKEYITLMNKWYEEGLIDQEFFNKTGTVPGNEYITTGRAGAFHGIYSNQAVYKATATDPNYNVGAVPFPRKSANDVAHFSRYNDAVGRNIYAITSACSDIELCLRWIDYGFTEEGYLLSNYGVEGETYEMVDGRPRFLPFMYDNSDGIPLGEMRDTYTDPKSGIYYIWSAGDMIYTEEELAAYDIWESSSDGAWIKSIHLTMTNDEGNEYSQTYGDIKTYVEESVVRFITGQTSMSEYDAFVGQIKSMGIERCIELWQAAQDRFVER